MFGDLMRGVRAHGSLFGSSTLSPPWSLHFVDGAPLTLCTVLAGAGWIVPEHVRPSRCAPATRSSYEAPRRSPSSTSSAPGRSRSRAVSSARRPSRAAPGTGSAGTTGGDKVSGATTLIVGAYPVRGEISRRLLDALPVVLRVDAGGTGDPVLDHLAAEVALDAPGQQVVLDRLLDWMLVCTLRDWFDRPGGEPPAWWTAQRDPVVGDALRLLHAEPGGAVDGVLAGRAHRGVALHTGQTVRRPGRRTAADLPHPLAHDARRRPAGRAEVGNRRRRRPRRRLRRTRSGSAQRSNGSAASTRANSGVPRSQRSIDKSRPSPPRSVRAQSIKLSPPVTHDRSQSSADPRHN